ncbi:MAG: MFS transporter [Dehalococcoidia bacterium]|nr:MFS transporter [Dehalococcoidia bacterium]
MRDVQTSSPALKDSDRLLTRDFTFLCLTNFFFFLTVYSLLITLPVYAVVLGGGEGQAGYVTAAITLISFLALPHLGRHVERLGRTSLLRLGPALVLIEALALPYVGWFPVLVAIGIACGGALACFQTGANNLVADLAPLRRRGEAMGIYGTFTTTAVALSPAVSIFVMRNNGFPVLFAMSAAMGTAALALAFVVREPRQHTVASAPGPLLNRMALLPAFCIFGITLTYGTLISFLPGQAAKIGMENAGLFFTAYSAASFMVRAAAGGVSDRLGRAPVIIPALIAVAIAMFFLSQSSGLAMVLGAAVLYGLGYGSAHPAIMAFAVDRAGPEARASAVATFYSGYNLGLAVGSLALGPILEATSFAFMIAVAGVAPLLAAITLYVRRSPSAITHQ